MENVCIGIYNMGVKLACDNTFVRARRCMCPDKQSYEYLCYLFSKKVKNNHTLKQYTLQLQKKTGKTIIVPEIDNVPLCDIIPKDDMAVIKIMGDASEDAMKKFADWGAEDQALMIYLVNMLQTKVLLYPDYSVMMQHLMAAYDTEVLTESIWNLIYTWLEGAREGEENEEILNILLVFMNNLVNIFESNQKISTQLEAYVKGTFRKLEDKEIPIDKARVYDQMKVVQKNGNCKHIDEFLFKEADGNFHAYKSVLDELLLVFKSFFETYVTYKSNKTNVDDNILNCLRELRLQEVDIHSIKGLERVTFDCEKAMKADIGLILEYMRKISKRNHFLICDRVA